MGMHPGDEGPIMGSLSRMAVLLCIVFLTLQTASAAQKREGQITGSIVTLSGNPLHDAVIRIFREVHEGELISIERTDHRGFFKSLHLTPGIYHLQVSHKGYRPVTTTRFAVDAGRNISLDIILQELLDHISNDDDLRNWGIGSVIRSTSDRRLIFRAHDFPRNFQVDTFGRNGDFGTAPFNRGGALSIASNTFLNTEGYLTSSESNQNRILSNIAFTEPVSPRGRFIFSMQMDHGNSSFWRVRDAFNYRPDKDHDYRISLSFGRMDVNYPGSSSFPARLTPQDPDIWQSGVEMVTFGVEGKTKLLDLLAINYALEYSHLHYVTDRTFLHPSFQILLTPTDKWSFRTSISSRRASDVNTIMLSDGEILNLSEPAIVNVIGNRVSLSQVRHSEFAAQRTFKGGTEVELAAYQDRTIGPGIPLMLTIKTPLEQQSNVIEMDEGQPVQRGMRLTVNRKLAAYLDSSVSYIYGGATMISAGDERLTSSELIEQLPKYMHRHYQHSLTARLNATIPNIRTSVLSTMRWNSDTPLTPLDWFSDRMDVGVKSVNFQIRQMIPLPELLGSTGKWEALVELRNMLNQGSEILSTSDGEITLNRYPRSVRCGINLVF
jgi:hypothetical protein